jgi:lysophospholipase L1-like esterase
MRWLVLGDSIAAGSNDYENGGWVEHLRKYIDIKSKSRVLYNISISAENTKFLLRRFENEIKARIYYRDPEEITIIIALGVNDSRKELLRPENEVSEEEFPENIKKIINIARKYAEKILWIGPTPVIEEKTTPYKEKAEFTNKKIEKYNEILKKTLKEKNVPYLELCYEWQKKNLEELFTDGLHLDTEAHRMLYEEIKEFIKSNE